jgi:hypothetical protein
MILNVNVESPYVQLIIYDRFLHCALDTHNYGSSNLGLKVTSEFLS